MHKFLTMALAGTATATLFAATAALAQPAPRMPDMTREAAEQHAAQMFERMDANSDGKLDAADREARADARAEAGFARADTDGNGSIDRAEFAAMREHRGEMREQRREHRMARHDGERRGPGMHEGHRGMGGPGMSEGRHGMGGPRGHMQMLAQADADHDGAISQAEFTTAMMARFDAADADHDGTLTRDERQQMRQLHRSARSGNPG